MTAAITVATALRRATQRLRHHGDSADLEARLLLAHVLGVPGTRLYTEPRAEIAAADIRRYEQLIGRRAGGEPLAYITGRCGFWTLELEVNPAVLVPRPDTETLVETALAVLPENSCAIADLGTGSGAVALALAGERRQWSITATDNSEQALACACGNARRIGLDNVRFVHGDWFWPLAGEQFDAIVSNPPYVAADDEHLRAPELGYEPVAALIAADHGLAALAHIAGNSLRHLKAGGWLMLEHGHDQGRAVRALFHEIGLESVETRPDIAGRPRVTTGRRGG